MPKLEQTAVDDVPPELAELDPAEFVDPGPLEEAVDVDAMGVEFIEALDEVGAAGAVELEEETPAEPDDQTLGPALWARTPKNNIAPSLRPLAIPIDSVFPDPNNANDHPDRNIDDIKNSLARHGQVKVIVVRAQDRVVLAGNGTLEAARSLGWTEIAANVHAMDEIDAIDYGIADNATGRSSQWNVPVLNRLTKMMQDAGRGVVGLSADELTSLRAAAEPTAPAGTAGPNLAERFVIPPFSVLDARQGVWQDRKRQWLSLGIKSELGRGDNALDMSASMAGITDPKEVEEWNKRRREGPKAEYRANNISPQALQLAGGFEEHPAHRGVLGGKRPNAAPGGSPRPAMKLGADGRTLRGDGVGRPLTTLGAIAPNEGGANGILTRSGTYAAGKAKAFNMGLQASKENQWSPEDNKGSGTSIFDPVICELAYRWFTPPDGHILDNFAGGSVRGIVAAKLGRAYTGIDLRPEQAAANEAQRVEICPDADLQWVVGDARDVVELTGGEQRFDFLMSCPPYLDLEVYSDDPRDLSTMAHADFMALYNQMIADACSLLRDDRFACYVVGDVRGKDGNYQNFVGDTISAFLAAGLHLYNHAILVTAVGSLPIRVGKQFAGARKLGTTHQHCLIFLKGNAKRATEACGTVDVTDLDALLSPSGESIDDGSV